MGLLVTDDLRKRISGQTRPNDIEKMSGYKNPYEVLGLTSSATLAEVCDFKSSPALTSSPLRQLVPTPHHHLAPPHYSQIKDAYRKLCMQHHPDLVPPAQREAAERYFKEVTASYTKLTRRK